ncbi:MAG: DUF5691 domain-containing protein [Saprospiraceae bacterium]
MDSFWNQMVRTVVVGAERQPVPEALLAALGMEAEGDAARTALLALPAAHVLQKAAAPLGIIASAIVPACRPDTRPLCPYQAVQPLLAMVVHGAHPAVLPEFFGLMNVRGCRLPPEVLPPVLDFLVQKKMVSPAAKTALEPLAGWLAAQNPVWAAYLKKQYTTSEAHEKNWSARMSERTEVAPDLESPESPLVKLLLEAEHLWPQPILYAVLEYPLIIKAARQWSPAKHLRAILQRAAIWCRPADALSYAPPAYEWPYAWHNELVQFHSTVKFRQRLWEIFRFSIP